MTNSRLKLSATKSKVSAVWLVAVVLSALGVFFAVDRAAGGGRQDVTAYGLHIRPLVDNQARINIYGPGGERIAQVNGEATDVYVTDHLSSTRLLLGPSRAISHEYDPYGETITDPAGTISFTGHPYDAQQGIYITPGRGYDSSLGRFLSPDSLRQGASPYTYAGQDPVTNLAVLSGPKSSSNIYVPFYIRSGFTTEMSSSNYRSPLAQSIRQVITQDGKIMVSPDTTFFQFDKGKTRGERFKDFGKRLINYENHSEIGEQHGDTVYWLVGDQQDLKKPLDVKEVFSEWRSMRPGIASNIIVIDTSGPKNLSKPIQDALNEARLKHTLISTTVDTKMTRAGNKSAVSFRVGNATLGRDEFSEHVKSIAASSALELFSQQQETSRQQQKLEMDLLDFDIAAGLHHAILKDKEQASGNSSGATPGYIPQQLDTKEDSGYYRLDPLLGYSVTPWDDHPGTFRRYNTVTNSRLKLSATKSKVSAVCLVAVVLSALGVFFAVDRAAGGGRQDVVAYGLHIRPLVDDQARINIYGPGGERIAQVNGEATDVYVTDHLSSTRLLLGPSRAISHEYDPYGETITDPAGTISFTGHPYDAQQGIYITPGRGYDSSLGRFLSPDSLRQGTSPYTYAGQDPVTNLDPKGNIYVPFFIRSGFSNEMSLNEMSSNIYRSPFAQSIRHAINQDGGVKVSPDTIFFQFDEEETRGERFQSHGRKLINYENHSKSGEQHGDTVYWLVGDQQDVKKPLDVKEVFSEWRSMRPGIAINIIVIDTTGPKNLSKPIQDALNEARLKHTLISTTVDTKMTRAGNKSAASFRVGNATLGRDEFSEHVKSIAASSALELFSQQQLERNLLDFDIAAGLHHAILNDREQASGSSSGATPGYIPQQLDSEGDSDIVDLIHSWDIPQPQGMTTLEPFEGPIP